MTPDASNRTITLLSVALFAVSGWAWFLHSTCTGDGRESSRDKTEWSILQALEATHRDSAISTVEFTERDGCRIICLPALDGSRTWIMLNPQSPPYYKQMPQTEYTLSEDQYSQIVRDHSPISTVELCLSSHVRRKP